MVYVDSNVFIYPVIYDDRVMKKAKTAKAILLKIAKGEVEASTATVTWDELVWVVRKTLGAKVAAREGRKFLEFPNLNVLSVDEKTVAEAQRITEKYGLRPRDAIHIGCAVENKIGEILSDDPDFDVVKEVSRIQLGAV
jgi:hypothetical protein